MHQQWKLLITIKRQAMKKLKNIHPGEILNEEFLLPLGISAYKLAKDTGIPQTRVSAIIRGNRRITADTALRFSKYFGNSAKFWLGLQDDYDIEEENNLLGNKLNAIRQYSNPTA
jgi:addiction module HigA family antidote